MNTEEKLKVAREALATCRFSRYSDGDGDHTRDHYFDASLVVRAITAIDAPAAPPVAASLAHEPSDGEIYAAVSRRHAPPELQAAADASLSLVAESVPASIDTPEFLELALKFHEQSSSEEFDEKAYKEAREKLTAHINAAMTAYGAQQYDAGFREGLADRLIGEVKREIELEDHLEKALAELAENKRTLDAMTDQIAVMEDGPATPAPAMGEELPLPAWPDWGIVEGSIRGFTGEQLNAYARACMALRQPVAEKAGDLSPDYSEMSRGAIERHAARMAQALADDKPRQFYAKYAIGPMRAPSCLCCGELPDNVGIRHAELPGVVICQVCVDAARPAASQAAPVSQPASELAPQDYLVTFTISIGRDKSVTSDVQTHDNSFADVAIGLLSIKAEIERVIAESKNCPHFPASREESQKKIVRSSRTVSQPAAQEPVSGDILPPVGSIVQIHLARQDEWADHTVTGYYAWPDLGSNPSLSRVFVRVVDANGHENARLLSDVRHAAALQTIAALEPTAPSPVDTTALATKLAREHHLTVPKFPVGYSWDRPGVGLYSEGQVRIIEYRTPDGGIGRCRLASEEETRFVLLMESLAARAVGGVDAAEPVVRLHEYTSDRPFTKGKKFFEMTVLDRSQCRDGLELFAAPVTTAAAKNGQAQAVGYNEGIEACASWHEGQAKGFEEQAAGNEADYKSVKGSGLPAEEIHLNRWCSSQAQQANHGDYASALRRLKAAAPAEGYLDFSLAGIGIYTCIGKGGKYENLGRAKPAGVLKGGPEVVVYRDVATGQVYYRTEDDFNNRMEKLP